MASYYSGKKVAADSNAQATSCNDALDLSTSSTDSTGSREKPQFLFLADVKDGDIYLVELKSRSKSASDLTTRVSAGGNELENAAKASVHESEFRRTPHGKLFNKKENASVPIAKQTIVKAEVDQTVTEHVDKGNRKQTLRHEKPGSRLPVSVPVEQKALQEESFTKNRRYTTKQKRPTGSGDKVSAASEEPQNAVNKKESDSDAEYGAETVARKHHKSSLRNAKQAQAPDNKSTRAKAEALGLPSTSSATESNAKKPKDQTNESNPNSPRKSSREKSPSASISSSTLDSEYEHETSKKSSGKRLEARKFDRPKDAQIAKPESIDLKPTATLKIDKLSIEKAQATQTIAMKEQFTQTQPVEPDNDRFAIEMLRSTHTYPLLPIPQVEIYAHRLAAGSVTPTALLSPSMSSPLTVVSENASEFDDNIVQLSRELAVAKAEIDSLRRQLERCNAQLHEQKNAKIVLEDSLRQRHTSQVKELNKELAAAKLVRSETEQAKVKLEGEVAKLAKELSELKSLHASYNDPEPKKALEDDIKVLEDEVSAKAQHPTSLGHSVRNSGESQSLAPQVGQINLDSETQMLRMAELKAQCDALLEENRKLNEKLTVHAENNEAKRTASAAVDFNADLNNKENADAANNDDSLNLQDQPRVVKEECERSKAKVFLKENVELNKQLPANRLTDVSDSSAEFSQNIKLQVADNCTQSTEQQLVPQEEIVNAVALPQVQADIASSNDENKDYVAKLEKQLQSAEASKLDLEANYLFKVKSMESMITNMKLQVKQLNAEIERLNVEKNAQSGASIVGRESPSRDSIGDKFGAEAAVAVDDGELNRALKFEQLNSEIESLRKTDTEKQSFINQIRKEFIDQQMLLNQLKSDKANKSKTKKKITAKLTKRFEIEKNKLISEVEAMKADLEIWKKRQAANAANAAQIGQASAEKAEVCDSSAVDKDSCVDLPVQAQLSAQINEERAKSAAYEKQLQSVATENAKLRQAEQLANDSCRDIEAKLAALLLQQSDYFAEIERKMSEKLEALSKASSLHDASFISFAKSLTEENLNLTRETLQVRTDSLALSTKCLRLDCDQQKMEEEHKTLKRDNEELSESLESHKQAIAKCEEHAKQLAKSNDSNTFLLERVRLLTEQLASADKRFKLLQLDTEMFMKRARNLDSANEEQMKQQMKIVVAQAERVNIDRVNLQNKILELQQKQEDLQRASAMQQKAVAAKDSDFKACLPESSGISSQCKNAAQQVEEKRKKLIIYEKIMRKPPPHTINQEVKKVNLESDATDTVDLIPISQSSTSTDDLLYNNEYFYPTYTPLQSSRDAYDSGISYLESVYDSSRQPKSTEIGASRQSPQSSIDFAASCDPVAIATVPKEEVVLTRSVPKLFAKQQKSELNRSKSRNPGHIVTSVSEVPMADAAVQTVESADFKVSSEQDEAFNLLVEQAKKTISLLDSLREQHEAAKSELQKKVEKLQIVECQLSDLSDALKLSVDEKLALAEKLEETKKDLKASRAKALNYKNKIKSASAEFEQQIAKLNDVSASEINKSKEQIAALEIELDLFKRQSQDASHEKITLEESLSASELELAAIKEWQKSIESKLAESDTQNNKTCKSEETQTATALPDTTASRKGAETVKQAANELATSSDLVEKDFREKEKLLLEKIKKLEKQVRKEKKLRAISEKHTRSVESDNADLRTALVNKKHASNADEENSIDFRNKSKRDVIDELINQSRNHAKMVLEVSKR